MAKVKHTFPPYKSPFGAEITEVLVDGAGCEWTQSKGGKWQCTPKKGGPCDRKEWTDDGCRVELSIMGVRKRFTIIYKCMCQNSIEDAL
jgi:hypothetical protein